MINITNLSNGIRVICEEMTYLRSVSFGLWVKVGSANEDEYNNGISHMIEHMLFKGTKNRSAKEIADEMASIGGNLNAFTSKECTSYYTRTLDEHIYKAIDIISDMILNSNIDESDLEKEKGIIIEEIDMYDDSPEDLVHEMLQKNIWNRHPLGYIISGEKENVRSFTRKDIIDYMLKHYVAENIVISLAGNFSSKEILPILEEKFGEIPSNKNLSETTVPEYNKCIYTKTKDIEQVHLNVAFDSISYLSEEKYTLSIVNSILGGSINSRLFMEIREELGLTYSIYTYGSSYKDAGLFHVYAAMNPSQTELVFDKIIEVIEKLKAEGITEDELIKTKEQIKTELIINSESTQSRMNTNGKSIICRGFITPLDDTIKKLNQVTTKDIKEFLEKYFNYSACSISLVGNLAEININKLEDKWKSL